RMAHALARQVPVDHAIASFPTPTPLAPKYAPAHANLGTALHYKGEVDEAVACYRQAIALAPKNVQVLANLGEAMYGKGQVDEAIAWFKKALAVDPNLGDVRTKLTKAERLAAVQDKLAAYLKGDFKPTTNDERLGLARWCQIKKHYHTSARLYADAFAADPKLADDLNAAARSAVLATAGKGEDAAKLDDKEKARLRQQALDWLKADLALPPPQMPT